MPFSVFIFSKVGETSTPENYLDGSDEISEIDDVIESIQLWQEDPDAINRLISSVAELGAYAQVKELAAFVVEILIDLLGKCQGKSRNSFQLKRAFRRRNRKWR
jgi:hypothetical protein